MRGVPMALFLANMLGVECLAFPYHLSRRGPQAIKPDSSSIPRSKACSVLFLFVIRHEEGMASSSVELHDSPS